MRFGPGGRPAQLHDRLARGRVTSGGYRYPVPGGMLETGENLRREYSIPREEQDEADFERMNVNGAGNSRGHPVGAAGVRILTTMLREMRRREATFGLETMCSGGGKGLTAIFRRVD